MDIRLKAKSPGVIGFEDPVDIKMTRMDAHKIYAEMEGLDLHGISLEFVEFRTKLGQIVDLAKKSNESNESNESDESD